jgi:cytoskeleton protein RodZ
MNNNMQIEETGIAPLTSGQQLRQAREAKGLTPEAIAKDLFINKQIIIHLENNDYAKIAAPAYARGYIISYARLLQLSIEPLLGELNQFENAANANNSFNKMPGLQPMRSHRPSHTEHTGQSNWIVYTVIILIIATATLWGYNHYKQRSALKPVDSKETQIVIEQQPPLNPTALTPITKQPEESVLSTGGTGTRNSNAVTNDNTNDASSRTKATSDKSSSSSTTNATTVNTATTNINSNNSNTDATTTTTISIPEINPKRSHVTTSAPTSTTNTNDDNPTTDSHVTITDTPIKNHKRR